MEREINLVLQLATPARGAKSISFDFRRYAAMVRDLVMSREPQAMDSGEPVSYTHLTLPTIYSV